MSTYFSHFHNEGSVQKCHINVVKPSDLLLKSHNAPVPYPTMHHFVTEMLQNGALWDICLMHHGICVMGPLIILHPTLPVVLFLICWVSAKLSYFQC